MILYLFSTSYYRSVFLKLLMTYFYSYNTINTEKHFTILIINM